MRLVFLIIIITIIIQTSSAQRISVNLLDTVHRYEVRGKDKTIFEGKYLRSKSDTLIFSSSAMPEIKILESNISKIYVVDPDNLKLRSGSGRRFFADQYLFLPSAICPQARTFRYENQDFLFNSVQYTPVDNISVKAGLFFFFSVYAELKISIPVRKNFWLGGGTILFPLGTLLDEHQFGILYGVATYGNFKNNISLAAGRSYSGYAYYSAGGVVGFGKFSFVAEAFNIPTNHNNIFLGNGAFRLNGRSACLDLGATIERTTNYDRTFGIPYLGVKVIL